MIIFYNKEEPNKSIEGGSIMKAAKLKNYGESDQIELLDIPLPTRNHGEVLVNVVASTINPVDIKTMTPQTIQEIQTFPATLGWDIAGIVTEVSSTSSFKIGDRVIGFNPPKGNGQGSWQQVVAISENQLVKLPESLDLSLAVTLPLAGLTALQALNRLTVDKQSTLLVTGALGSVGGVAVQLAKYNGFHVSGLVRKDSQKEMVYPLGADHVYSDGDTLPEFDAIFDTAGIINRPELIKKDGQLVTISDDEISIEVTHKSSFAVHNYVRNDKEGLKQLVRLTKQGRMDLRIQESFAFKDMQKAIQIFNKGGHNGKITITF